MAKLHSMMGLDFALEDTYKVAVKNEVYITAPVRAPRIASNHCIGGCPQAQGELRYRFGRQTSALSKACTKR